jgi:hypothetical protein
VSHQLLICAPSASASTPRRNGLADTRLHSLNFRGGTWMQAAQCQDDTSYPPTVHAQGTWNMEYDACMFITRGTPA